MTPKDNNIYIYYRILSGSKKTSLDCDTIGFKDPRPY